MTGPSELSAFAQSSIDKHKTTIFCELFSVRRYREFTKEKENTAHNIFKFTVQHLEKNRNYQRSFHWPLQISSKILHTQRERHYCSHRNIFLSASIESPGRKSDTVSQRKRISSSL